MQLYINAKNSSNIITWTYVIYNPKTKKCFGMVDLKHLPSSLSYNWFDPCKYTCDLYIEFDNIDNLSNTNPELFI